MQSLILTLGTVFPVFLNSDSRYTEKSSVFDKCIDVYEYFSLLLVLKGTLKVETDIVYTVQKNEYLLLPPSPTKNIILYNNEYNCKYNCVNFAYQGEFVLCEDVHKDSILKKDIHPNHFTIPKMSIILPLHGKFESDEIHMYLREDDYFKNQVDLLSILSSLHKINLSGNFSSSSLPSMVRQYINYNYLKTSVKEIAQHFNYSEDYITKSYKKYYGVTIKEDLLNLKMTYSKNILLSHNISFVSQCLGYSNESNFSRQFKKYFKVTPIQFIKSGGVSF